MLKGDLPYYDGRPVEISSAGWLVIVASVVAALALLITLPFQAFPLNLVPAVLFTGIPILALAAVSARHHAALFGRVGIRDLLIALRFGMATVVISIIVGLILSQVTSMTANATLDMLVNVGPFDIIVFLVRTFIQLVGEELMTILPLLAVLWFCVRKLSMSRTTGLIIAVVASTLWFSAVHLPTYNWNFIQCFGGIGAARLMLTMAFLVTRKLWVSAGAHIINDWSEFFIPMLVDAVGGHTPINPTA